MTPWRALIGPRLPLLGCLLSLLVAFPALAKEYKVPFVMEAIPGEALIDMVNTTQANSLMADGTRLRLSDAKNAIIVRKLGRERIIPLYATFGSIDSVQGETVSLSGSDYNRKTLVHIPTGRRTEFVVEKNNYSVQHNGVMFYIQNGSAHAIDYKNARVVSAKTTAKDSSGIHFFRDGKGNQIFQLDGSGEYFLIAEDKSIRLGSYPAKAMSFVDCITFQSTITYCKNGTEAWAADFVNGIFKKLEPTDKIKATHPTQSKVLVTFKGKDDEDDDGSMAIVDLKSGTRTEIKKSTEGFGNLISGRSIYLWTTDESPKVLLISTGLLGRNAKYDVRAMTLQEMWNALEAEKPIDAMFGTGVSLGTDTDINRLLYATQGGGSVLTSGTFRVDINNRIYRIIDTRRPDDTIVLGPVPSNATLKMIEGTSFAYLSTYSNNISVVMLLDLRSGRIFELGSSYTNPEYSKESQTLVVRASTIHSLYSMQLFSAYLNSGTRFGVGERPNSTPLAEQVVADCSLDAGPASDAVINRLLELRHPGMIFDDQELMQLLTYRLGQTERAIVAQIFQRYYLEDPEHAMLLFRKFKLYDRLEGDSDKLQMNPCLDQYGNQAVLKVLDDAVKFKDGDNKRPISFTEIAHLLVYAPYFKKHGYDSGSRRESLAERLATGAQGHPMAAGIFYSKLFYFANGVIGAIMGHKREFKTDITVLVDGNNVVSQLLSTHPTTGSRAVRSSFGFYMTTVDSFTTPKSAVTGQKFTHEVKWRSNNRDFRADINLTAANDLREFVPATPSMDHEAIRKDGKIVGLMVVGSNLGASHARRTVFQYRSYYSAKGYTFGGETKQEKFVDWIKEKIRGGEVDYLIKEAHSDGDEKNLVRAASQATVVLGRKASSAPGVPEETVYLVMPYYEKDNIIGGDELIGNQMFGEWIREREANGSGPLIYFNTSCSSFYKVIRELTAAKSSSLVAIPSITSVLMFRNSWDNATAMLIDGVLKGEDWKTMRTNLDTIPKVKKGEEDVFALPTDAKFDEYIRQALGFALEDDVKIYDVQQNQLVNIDEFNSH